MLPEGTTRRFLTIVFIIVAASVLLGFYLLYANEQIKPNDTEKTSKAIPNSYIVSMQTNIFHS